MIWEDDYSPFIRREPVTPVQSEVVVYGTGWCGMTQMVRRYLDRMGVPYRFVDLDNNSEALTQLRWITGGYTGHPTVVVNGQAIIEPSMYELRRVLVKNGYI